MLFVTGETVAVLLIFIGAALLFFLPLIDNRPAGRKGKIITWAAPALIVYAVAMSVWSLSGAKAQPESIVPRPGEHQGEHGHLCLSRLDVAVHRRSFLSSPV